MKKDIYGKGLLSYLDHDKNAVFTVESNIAETETWPIAIFFRSYSEMPAVEKEALHLCRGKILDVGAGTGSHSLWLQEQQQDVTAIDLSEGAVEVMKRRGVKSTRQADFFTLPEEKFDTLLFMMNGIGITGMLEKLPLFLGQCSKLLNKGGQILLDSSDLIYLFEEEDGTIYIDLNGPYYGEMEYTFSFEDKKDETFQWLFVDFQTLSQHAEDAGFSCEKLYEDDHFLYLARLTKKKDNNF